MSNSRELSVTKILQHDQFTKYFKVCENKIKTNRFSFPARINLPNKSILTQPRYFDSKLSVLKATLKLTHNNKIEKEAPNVVVFTFG